MARPTLTRDWYIPPNSKEIKPDDDTKAVAYLYRQNNGKWCAMGFGGKRQKPDWHNAFLSGADALAHIERYFAGQRAHAEEKAKRRQAQTAFTTSLVAGDLLYTSWGYEQTNVEWFQVIEVKPSGKTVVLREVARQVEETGFMSGKSTPAKDQFIGDPLTKRVRKGDAVTISKVRSAYKWDGRPKYCSWYA